MRVTYLHDWSLIWIQFTNIPEMSKKFRKVYHQELDVFPYGLISLRKWAKKRTDRHTRNSKLF